MCTTLFMPPTTHLNLISLATCALVRQALQVAIHLYSQKGYLFSPSYVFHHIHKWISKGKEMIFRLFKSPSQALLKPKGVNPKAWATEVKIISRTTLN